MSTKTLVTIAGQQLDVNSLEDSLIMQAKLLPADYAGNKEDAVRLFLNLRNMFAAEWDRHFSHNFKRMLRQAAFLRDDEEKPIVSFGFRGEIDFSVETVAAIGGTKMKIGGGFSSEGKAKTFDINQGDLFEDDSALDPESLENEEKAEKEREAAEQAEADKAKADRDAASASENPPAEGEGAAAEDDAGAADTGGNVEPFPEGKKKGGKKKVAKKGKK